MVNTLKFSVYKLHGIASKDCRVEHVMTTKSVSRASSDCRAGQLMTVEWSVI